MAMLAMPEDWDRAIVVAAHPDDIEYGIASIAIAGVLYLGLVARQL